MKCWKLITTRSARPIIELDISYTGQKYLTPCKLWREKKRWSRVERNGEGREIRESGRRKGGGWERNRGWKAQKIN